MEITEVLKSANAAFYRAIDSGSLDRMEELWAHEEFVQCVHPGWSLVSGWARVRQSWEQIFAGGQKMRISATDVAVNYVGELAWVTCTENITIFEDTNFDTVQAVATNFFMQRGEKWLLVHHHASPIPMLVPDAESNIIQ
ncbi:MAG: nuclear transport factor 2 family protein [Acidobacteria bacterium]|nr:nuclear transport factor 2 family protein [Acidobacteriota bacterium]